jgi:hypothetical protein
MTGGPRRWLKHKRSSRRGARRGIARRERVLLFIALIAALIGGASPALARQPGTDGDDLVILTGRADVSEGETIAGVVIFDGPVSVDGTVQGDVVAFNGRVTVTGTVTGDIVSFNGRVSVAQGGRVGGDIRSRTSPQIAQGADVRGDLRGLDFRMVDTGLAAARFGIWIAFAVSTLVLALAFVGLFPRGADGADAAGVSRTGASIAWGLGVFFGVPILGLLLLITIVGIPLGIGLLLVIAPLYALGFTIAAYFLGRRIVTPPRSRALAALVGVVILSVVTLVPILGELAWFAGTVFGLGLLAVAATTRGRETPAPAASAA